jgi:ubiquinone/menaquinone biosynthesis C-methylase UbiE
MCSPRTDEVSHAGRDQLLREIREKALDLVGPTYILDRRFRFVDWNPAFEELVARPLKLVRGQHAGRLLAALCNAGEVVEHSIDAFVGCEPPQVDTELLTLQSSEHGIVTFRKIAAQIPDDHGAVLGWSVHLAVVAAPDLDRLWASLVRRLEREVTWSKYAAVYDSLLLNFPDYLQLLAAVAVEVADAEFCLDLGTGTGNSAFALLDQNLRRTVWAVDSNEIMLRQLRRKIDARNETRIHIFKADIHSMPEFACESFDAAIMVNTLYALDDPAACLGEVARVLKPGAVLALSTPHRQTDVDALFARMRDALAEKGIFESLAEAFDAARQRHAAIEGQIHRFTVEDVRCLLESRGFVVERVEPAYVDAVVIVRARTKQARNQ